jgi:hypothetical protein
VAGQLVDLFLNELQILRQLAAVTAEEFLIDANPRPPIAARTLISGISMLR